MISRCLSVVTLFALPAYGQPFSDIKNRDEQRQSGNTKAGSRN